jgi:hypothetical protein
MKVSILFPCYYIEECDEHAKVTRCDTKESAEFSLSTMNQTFALLKHCFTSRDRLDETIMRYLANHRGIYQYWAPLVEVDGPPLCLKTGRLLY